MKDNSIHKYSFENNSIYYIVIDEIGIKQKNIKLCEDIDECVFSSENDKIKVKMIINGMIYNNSFTVK